jgi:hypothetical protein
VERPTRYVSTLGKSGAEDPDNQLLYHYTDAATALDEVLAKRTLRFMPSLSMSDPLEHSPPRVLVVNQDGAPYGRETTNDVNETLDGLRSRFRQLSLTMDATGFVEPLGRGYARARMWDRYGVNHTGVCLAFDADSIVNSFLESARQLGVVNCRPVGYDDDLMVSGPASLQIDGLDEGNYAQIFTDFVMANEGRLFFTKLLEWDTEYEYRFLMAGEEEALSPVDVPFGSALRAIIVGERFDLSRQDRVFDLARALKVVTVRLSWIGGFPSVEPFETSPS